MKFWELVSVFRDEPERLDEILSKPEWKMFLDRYRNFPTLVGEQSRALLDTPMPEKLLSEAFQAHTGKLYRSRDFVRTKPNANDDIATPYHIIFHEFGGPFIEEILERGALEIPRKQRL